MEDSIYIKRLKERLRQNRDSKVFLSLAEELRKKDRMDEAIAVLIDGIKRHPEFLAARLTLGRWYLFNEMFSEAQKQYSEVIKQSPDNIFARRGLDEINKRLGIVEEKVPDLLVSPSHKNKEAVIARLNKLLEEIKIRFAHPLSMASGDKDAVVNRLNGFLNAIKIHFASSNLS